MPNHMNLRNAAGVPEPPVCEPLVINDIAVDEIEVRAGRHSVKFVGLVIVPSIGGEPAERRVVMRASLPLDAAQALWADLAAALRAESPEGRLAFASVQSRDRAKDN